MRKTATFFLSFMILGLALLFFSASSVEQIFGSTEVVLAPQELEKMHFEPGDSVTVTPDSFVNEDDRDIAEHRGQVSDAWTRPIKVPVFKLEGQYDGWAIVENSEPGTQSSITLKSDQGTLYELSPIRQYSKNRSPGIVRVMGLESRPSENPSVSHPYASVLVAALASKASITINEPVMVYVPKQEGLENWNQIIGNQLCLLEYKADGGSNWTNHNKVLSLKSTADVLSLKERLGSRFFVDKEAYVRSRLFDLLIGDWSVHPSDYGWMIEEHGRQLKATPISTGHYGAFYNFGELLKRLNSDRESQSELYQFHSELDLLSGFVDTLDLMVLRELSEKQFITEARRLQLSLTDQNLRTIISGLPDYLNDLNHGEWLRTTKTRRDNLLDFAKELKQIVDIRNNLYVREEFIDNENITLAGD